MNRHDDLRISHEVFEAVDFSWNPAFRILERYLKLPVGCVAAGEKRTPPRVE
jgi:hypothetical protein